jgi:hypothetical protein
MQMENLVHDLPFSVDFEQGKQIREPMPGPVLKLESDHQRETFRAKLAGPQFIDSVSLTEESSIAKSLNGKILYFKCRRHCNEDGGKVTFGYRDIISYPIDKLSAR